MSSRPWTLMKSHAKAKLWRQDRTDPSGRPITHFRGATFMKMPNGEFVQTPEDPLFGTLAEGEAWFDAQTADDA